MKLIYDGKVIREILGGNNLTIDEICDLCEINLKEQDLSGEYIWDYEKLDLICD